MDLVSSIRENIKTGWKGIVANSSVLPQRPSNVMRWNRESTKAIEHGMQEIYCFSFFPDGVKKKKCVGQTYARLF